MSAGVSIRVESNGEQDLVVLEGERVYGVIGIRRDVNNTEAYELLDSIDAEVSQSVGLTRRRGGRE